MFDVCPARCYTFAKVVALKLRNAWMAGLVLLVFMAVLVRLRLLSIPLERDEGEFAYLGQLMLQGIPPYQLAFNIKMPGTYAAYAVIMALFGQSPSGIHLGFLFINLGNLALLFFLARRFLDEAGVLICCASFILLSLSMCVLGLQAHAAHVVTMLALGGLCLLLRAREKGQRPTLFLSGLLFGFSFLCKQPGLFFGLFALALLARDGWVAGKWQGRRCVSNILLFTLGLVTPLALTCLIMWRAGTFGRFWFWTVVFPQVHTGMVSVGAMWHRLAQALQHGGGGVPQPFLAPAGLTVHPTQVPPYRFEFGLFLTGFAGWLWLLFQKGQAERKFIFSGFLIASVLALIVGRNFFRHYFVFMLPALSLLLGLVVPAWAERLARTRFPLWRLLPAGLFLWACAGVIQRNAPAWFEMSPAAVCRTIYPGTAFVECVEIGRYLREHSTPGDRMVVLGSEPEIYFYAHRHSVSGYLYMYDLADPQPYAGAMQQEFSHDIEKAKPEFLVMINTNLGSSWGIHSETDPVFLDWIRSCPGPSYDLIGLTEIFPTHTEYHWGKEAASETLKTDFSIFTYKRKGPGT